MRIVGRPPGPLLQAGLTLFGYWTLAAFLASSPACCALARLVIIDDFDPSIVYNKPVLPQEACKNNPGNDACEGNWWYELGDSGGQDVNNTIHDTFGPGTVATMQFKGYSIELYGVLLNVGAKATVTVDQDPPFPIDLSKGLPENVTLVPKQLLYSKTGLDGTKSHTIVVAYDDSSFGPANSRRWLGIDYFVVDEPDESTSTSTSDPNSSSETPPSSSLPNDTSPSSDSQNAGKTHKSSNTGVIVGGVIGGVALGLIAALLALFIRRRILRDRAAAQEMHEASPYLARPNYALQSQPPHSPVYFQPSSHQPSVTTGSHVGAAAASAASWPSAMGSSSAYSQPEQPLNPAGNAAAVPPPYSPGAGGITRLPSLLRSKGPRG
ncbi:hypothetical protein AURDEDRAFT_112692 [Auricularia subglabra TFB-10046 SS5]|nr:hypothetical protein AURDEDRAFT_112692 [Auricularia subglabra TFB-10046 SS5]